MLLFSVSLWEHQVILFRIVDKRVKIILLPVWLFFDDVFVKDLNRLGKMWKISPTRRDACIGFYIRKKADKKLFH